VLIPSVRALPGASTGVWFSIDGIGATLRNTINIMRLQMETQAGGAAGGDITVLERSGLGNCQMTVPTNAGHAGIP
jgi:hypothetical protein